MAYFVIPSFVTCLLLCVTGQAQAAVVAMVVGGRGAYLNDLHESLVSECDTVVLTCMIVPEGSSTSRSRLQIADDIGSKSGLDIDISGSAAMATANTAALRAACSGELKRIHLPPGVVNIDDVITCSTAGFEFVGAGPGTTEIHQTNAAAGVFLLDESFGIGGGVRDLAISGPSPHFNAAGSSGTAIDVTHCNEGFAVRNVHIRNMDVGIKRTNCYSDRYADVDIRYFRTAGIWTSVVASGDPTNDGKFSHIKIQNIQMVQADGVTPLVPDPASNTVSNSREIGMFWQQSGGDQLDSIDIINTGTAIVLQPPAGKYLAYLRFSNVQADTSYYDNCVIDALAGSITRIEFDQLWAAYATNGSGVVVLGRNLDGMRISGDVRENGKHGVDLQGGKNILLSGFEAARNSKLTTLTYHGVHVGGAVSNWSWVGGGSGNYSSGLTSSQLDGLRIDPGSEHWTVMGVDLSNPGIGGNSMSNNSAATDYILTGNRPNGAGVNGHPGR